jgi:hypothetical protein
VKINKKLPSLFTKTQNRLVYHYDAVYLPALSTCRKVSYHTDHTSGGFTVSVYFETAPLDMLALPDKHYTNE